MTAKQAHREAVLERDRECQGPGPHRGRLQAHHVIPVRRLRNAGLEDAISDPRNGAALCEFCHNYAEYHSFPYPAAVKAEVQAFADEYGFFKSRERGWLPQSPPVVKEEVA